ncbi:MAG: hypothetical protein RLZZ401_293 [Pseudomonadota bacterium]|jgi:hypothetical protein
MSWLDRLFAKPQHLPSGQSRTVAGERRISADPAGANPSGLNRRKADRVAHREKMHGVVRESMAFVGVRSSHYKFKVLAIDPAATQFVVMIDILGAVSPDIQRLSDMEATITQKARSQRGMEVIAVYWRLTDVTALERPARASQPAPAAVARKGDHVPTVPARVASVDGDVREIGGTQYGDLG